MKRRFNHKIKEVVEFSEMVRVTDPSYSLDVFSWCVSTVKVVPGTYNCWYQEYDDCSCFRISSITAIRKGYKGLKQWEYVGSVAVDSGQCGIFDSAYFQGNCNEKGVVKEDWYFKICDLTYVAEDDHPRKSVVVDGKCLVSSSGYGDGEYALYVIRNENGLIEGIKVKYM